MGSRRPEACREGHRARETDRGWGQDLRGGRSGCKDQGSRRPAARGKGQMDDTGSQGKELGV